MKVLENITLLQAVVISKAIVRLKVANEGVINSLHATPEEQAEAWNDNLVIDQLLHPEAQ